MFIITTQRLFLTLFMFIAGICWSSSIAISLTISSLCGLTAYYIKKEEAYILLFFACSFFIGNARLHQTEIQYFDHSRFLTKPCNAVCVIKEIKTHPETNDLSCLLIYIKSIEKEAINKFACVFVPQYQIKKLLPNQTILLKNIIFKHPNSTSYERYLIKEGLWSVAHPKSFYYKTISRPSSLSSIGNYLSSKTSGSLNQNLSPLAQSLYLSIFCGQKTKSEATIKMKHLFQYWGISHHLARSGLHLVLLIGLISFFLSFFPCFFATKQVFIFSILLGYYSITTPSIAFIRSLCMYFFYIVCQQSYAPCKSLHILLLTCILVLCHNPHQLFFLDFQLSFGITLLILWFCQLDQKEKTIAS